MLAHYAYDNLGRRSTVTRGNGVGTTYGYDPVSRLTSIAHNLSGTANDVTFTLGYNPASQIVSRVISNNAYLFDYANQNTSYTNNGRNELTNAGGSNFTYDSNRNVTNDGTRAYTYDAANRMLSAASTNFTYDPTGALYDIGAHRLASVGGERLALYTTSGGALHRRIVPGASFDEAAAYYHGSGTTTRQWPLADQLGSVIAYANASGAAANINTYDEYGRPGSGNAEFLQYTGQLAIASAPGVYNYRNRFYQADVGRFLQTDPILYGAGLNFYAYVGNDPLNWTDPWGLRRMVCTPDEEEGAGAECRWDYSDEWGVRRWLEQLLGLERPPERPWAGIRREGSDELGRQIVCSLPEIDVSGGVDAYQGVGGSYTGSVSFNPRNGQFSVGQEVGIGGGSASLDAYRQVEVPVVLPLHRAPRAR